MALTWQQPRQIAELLFEKYDTLDPRTVRLVDVRKWVLDLEDFAGRPDQADDKALTAIQKAWFDEWNEEYGDD